MRGLAAIPSERELSDAYQVLQHPGASVPEAAIAKWIQWSRFDPRLAEILVGYLATNWVGVKGGELRRFLLREPWPGAAGVILAFSAYDVAAEDRGAYFAWVRSVLHGVEAAPNEQFFIGLRRPGGKFMEEDARFSLSEYRDWGYLGREILLNKRADVGSLRPDTRREILRDLLERQPRLSVTEYWEACGRRISLRQAERDLRDSDLVRARGRTKGRVYVRRAG